MFFSNYVTNNITEMEQYILPNLYTLTYVKENISCVKVMESLLLRVITILSKPMSTSSLITPPMRSVHSPVISILPILKYLITRSLKNDMENLYFNSHNENVSKFFQIIKNVAKLLYRGWNATEK